MAQIINLNKARKKKAREAASAQADANRLKFGRTKEQRALEAAQAKEAQHRLDQLRREPDEAQDPTGV